MLVFIGKLSLSTQMSTHLTSRRCSNYEVSLYFPNKKTLVMKIPLRKLGGFGALVTVRNGLRKPYANGQHKYTLESNSEMLLLGKDPLESAGTQNPRLFGCISAGRGRWICLMWSMGFRWGSSLCVIYECKRFNMILYCILHWGWNRIWLCRYFVSKWKRIHFNLTLMLLVTNFAYTKWCKNAEKMTETLAYVYSSERTQWELSNEYQHGRI